MWCFSEERGVVTTRKTDHCYIIIFTAYHPMIGAIFWYWRREVVSMCVVGVLSSDSVSHHLAANDASEPADRDRFG